MSPEAKEIAAEQQWHAADALKRAADAQR